MTTRAITATLEATIARHPANHSRPAPVLHELDTERWSTCDCGWTSADTSPLTLEEQMARHRRLHGGAT